MSIEEIDFGDVDPVQTDRFDVLPESWEIQKVIRSARFELDDAGASNETIVLASGVDTSHWRAGTLEVLLHENSSWPLLTTATIVVEAVSLNPINPQIEYVGSVLAEIQLTEDSKAGTQFLDDFSTVSEMCRIRLSWAERTPGTACTFTLSVNLIGRTVRTF